MDIIQFEKMYPTPSHAAEAERFERLPEADRARFKYLMRSRRRSVDALASATKWIDQDYLQETIDMIDRMLGALLIMKWLTPVIVRWLWSDRNPYLSQPSTGARVGQPNP